MTREEAILLLHDMKDTYDEIHENTSGEIGYEQMTAIDMAIEALSAEYEDYEHATLVDIKEPLKVLVVRCKDCRHNVVTKDGEYNEEDIVCDYWLSDGLDSNDFCSHGERRK